MIGNVWQWCRDGYVDYKKGPVTDPVGAATSVYRVDRGGSWCAGPTACRSGYRPDPHYGPSGREDTIGFRVSVVVDAE
jgi:formylglycine-generating enzyme required for sulfatase activity